MLIAEALLLFALDDEKGTVDSGVWMQIDNTLAGALLLELALRERVAVSSDAEPAGPYGDVLKPGRLILRNQVLTGHPVLDDVLQRLPKAAGKKVYWALQIAGKGARDALLEQLSQAGLISRDRAKVFGLFPQTVWPTLNGQPEAQLRAQVLSVLDDGAEPDQLTGSLIALMNSAGILNALFPASDKHQRKARKARAADVVAGMKTGQWAIAATAEAIQAAIIAIGAVAAASTVNTVIITS